MSDNTSKTSTTFYKLHRLKDYSGKADSKVINIHVNTITSRVPYSNTAHVELPYSELFRILNSSNSDYKELNRREQAAFIHFNDLYVPHF